MSGGRLHGVLPVDKPPGPTSHDIVERARRAIGERRVGHTGTLDPFASGLLLLCVGEATRLAEYLSGLEKTYEATARLGVATDSGDVDGEVVATSERWEHVTTAALEGALAGLRGEILQVPPGLSAKKLEGVPAHRRVRRGEDVELAPRRVTVHELVVLSHEPPEVRLRVRCSAGTYVRALARDLGEILGVGAHLTALRRTAVGAFDVRSALTPDVLVEPGRVAGALLGPLEAVGHLRRVDVDAEAAASLRHGRAIEVGDGVAAGISVAASGGVLVAVGEIRNRSFRPHKVFAHG